jgi:hypothetical protein
MSDQGPLEKNPINMYQSRFLLPDDYRDGDVNGMQKILKLFSCL